MIGLRIFSFEFKHFIRSPFKVVALVLFLIAGIYGLRNGANLYHNQQAEIESINQKIKEEQELVLSYYDKDKGGPENRPWVNVRVPLWAIWYSSVYKFKKPAPTMVYGVGQAEQYGFYKKVTTQSSTYDSDMIEELSNPERLQSGKLDFCFVVLFLSPLLLLILTYNIRSYEDERGFLALVLVQSASNARWLFTRFLFYVTMLVLAIALLMLYGATLTEVTKSFNTMLFKILALSLTYLLFWSVLFAFIVFKGKTILQNTVQMAGLYLLFTFIIPAAVHQWVSIERPANLMIDYIDASRDKVYDLYDAPDSLVQAKLFRLFPEIAKTNIANDSIRKTEAMNYSFSALSNQLMKESIQKLEQESKEKNSIVYRSYWFNPVAFFQNTFNRYTETHYQNYKEYRTEIQNTIDQQIKVLVLDTYNDVTVDKSKYLSYIKQLNDTQKNF